MNSLFRKILITIAFIINIVLGKLAFNYFFGLAWGPEHYGGMLGVLGRIFIIGCCGGFILGFMPSLLWPQRIWIWCLGFPFNTMLFGSGIVLSVLFGYFDQFPSAAFWFGSGIAMATSSFYGAKLAKSIVSNRSIKNT